MLKTPAADLFQKACGERTKKFCSHQCSPECSTNSYLKSWWLHGRRLKYERGDRKHESKGYYGITKSKWAIGQ